MKSDQVDGNVPPELLNDDPDGFAWGVWHDRTPKLVAQIRDASPYDADQRWALDVLLDEIADGLMQPLPLDSHDHDVWMSWGKDLYGRPWQEAPFLWSESYFFRRVLEATRFFRPGPWQGVDPFGQMKAAELHSPELAADMATLDDVEQLPSDPQAQAKLVAALWGNQADLGFRVGRSGHAAPPGAADLIVDQSAALWSTLGADGDADVVLVADNAGRELAADLVLVDHLLRYGQARSVTIHVKPQPYYVSDATTADVVAVLRRLADAPEPASAVAERLRAYAAHARLLLATHDFYCAPWSYHHMPADLADTFAASTLTIVKGDLNYRRLVGDRAWDATTSFAEVMSYFPASVASLRTLKSDVIVGLDPTTRARLDATGHPWRTNGQHAVLQVANLQ